MSLSQGELPHLCGYLEKQRPRNIKTWQRRWFVLVFGELVYYLREEDPKPLKRVPLGDVIEITTIPEKNIIILQLINKPLKLRCASAEEVTRWKQAFDKSRNLIRAKLAAVSAPVERQSIARATSSSISSNSSSSNNNNNNNEYGLFASGSSLLTSEGGGGGSELAKQRKRSVIDIIKDAGNTMAEKSRTVKSFTRTKMREKMTRLHDARQTDSDMKLLLQGLKPSETYYRCVTTNFDTSQKRSLTSAAACGMLGAHMQTCDIEFEPSDLGRLLVSLGNVLQCEETQLMHGEDGSPSVNAISTEIISDLKDLSQVFQQVLERRRKFKDTARKFGVSPTSFSSSLTAPSTDTVLIDPLLDLAAPEGGGGEGGSGGNGGGGEGGNEDGGGRATTPTSSQQQPPAVPKSPAHGPISEDSPSHAIHVAREWFLFSCEELDTAKLSIGEKMHQLLLAKKRYHEQVLAAIDSSLQTIASSVEHIDQTVSGSKSDVRAAAAAWKKFQIASAPTAAPPAREGEGGGGGGGNGDGGGGGGGRRRRGGDEIPPMREQDAGSRSMTEVVGTYYKVEREEEEKKEEEGVEKKEEVEEVEPPAGDVEKSDEKKDDDDGSNSNNNQNINDEKANLDNSTKNDTTNNINIEEDTAPAPSQPSNVPTDFDEDDEEDPPPPPEEDIA